MNIVEINQVNYGSTGNIMLQIACEAETQGHRVWVAYPCYESNISKDIMNAIPFGHRIAFSVHQRMAKYLGLNGCGSICSTLNLLRKIDACKPDLIQLHNLHNCYINIHLLFFYLKRKGVPVIWTLHDCWTMTGQCAHFDMVGCQKWKNGCYECPQLNTYPASRVDRTRLMWKLKKFSFCGVKNLTLVTPSQWIADRAAESYLGKYPVRVINNGIDLSVFYYRESNFRAKHGIDSSTFIILGVAFVWGERKGLDVFIELSNRLDDRYQIVLVGTNDNIDKMLPENIISIHRTQNQVQLAEIYSAADVYVNPTREEALGLVNIEANACGTPVITFAAGGSPECIDETSGIVVDKDDVDEMEKEIVRICQTKPFSKEDCRKQAVKFDKNKIYREYLSLYNTVMKSD